MDSDRVPQSRDSVCNPEQGSSKENFGLLAVVLCSLFFCISFSMAEKAEFGGSQNFGLPPATNQLAGNSNPRKMLPDGTFWNTAFPHNGIVAFQKQHHWFWFRPIVKAGRSLRP